MTLRPPLDIRVDIAPDAEPDGDPGAWLWRDVSAYRRQRADIEINVGRGDESAEVEASDSSLTCDLRDGLLSPRNPNSELFGRIGVNTPMRYRLRTAFDTFDGRTVGSGLGTSTSGHSWATAGSAYSVSAGRAVCTLDLPNRVGTAHLTGAGALDLDVVYSIVTPTAILGGPWISAVELRRQDVDNLYRVHTELKPAGEVTIKVTRRLNGVTTDVTPSVSVAAAYAVNQKVFTRIQADGGLIRARFWVGTLGAEPVGTWQVTADDSAVDGVLFGFYQWRHSTNTNPGALTVYLDDLTTQAFIWQGNVPEWAPTWDKSGEDATVPLEGAGPLRRLNQGEDPIRSPLARQLPRYKPAGYWPLEDSTAATSAASGIAGGRAATLVGGVSFVTDDTPLGGSGAAKLAGAGAAIKGVIGGNTTGNFSAMMLLRMPAIPTAPAEPAVIEWTSTTGTLRRWIIYANSVGWVVRVYDDDGALAHDSGTLVYTDAPTQWMTVRLQAVQSGANVNWQLAWYRLGAGLSYGLGGTIASKTSARLATFRVYGTAALPDLAVSHLWAGTSALPFLDRPFLDVAVGYSGELAADRIARLCAEEGVRVAVHAGDSEPLGRQTAARFLDLLRQAAEADLGVLYERAHSIGYIPRGGRYNRPVAMTLDWSGGQLAEAPRPKDDDQRLRNRWVVSRFEGSEATYENAESIKRHGAIGSSVEVNINEDRRLPWHAGWRTHLTTLDEMRWPEIEIDLVAHPELIPAFLGVRVGSRIRLINPKTQVAGASIDLIVEGISQKIGKHRWRATLTCSPAKLWDVALWSTSTKRWGAQTTTTQSARAAGVTTIPITTASRHEIWSTTANGYQWLLAGELVTVQSITAATGTGPYLQTATVLRAQNGVSKTIPAGTPVRMAEPARWAL